MRITAIQNYGYGPSVHNRHQMRHRATLPTPEQKSDVLTFQKNETAKGAGIGACIGLAALAILSGGAATPLICGIYAGTAGLAGGMLGNAIESAKEDSDNAYKEHNEENGIEDDDDNTEPYDY